MSRDGPTGPVKAVSSDEFRRACGRFATGVTIASVLDENGTAHGLTVSSFTSVSLEPPLILICVGHEVTMIEAFRRASHFGLSVLREEDREISTRFATKGRDRFNAVGWHQGNTGVPLIDRVLASFECEVHQRFTSGDHDILVGRVVETRIDDGPPLIYFASGYRKLTSE